MPEDTEIRKEYTEEEEVPFMILKDIVMQTDFYEMWNYLISQYKDYLISLYNSQYSDGDDRRLLQGGEYNDLYLDAYLSIFERLQSIGPVESNLEIVISYTDENEWRVYGVDKNEENERYALDFIPWKELLGMKIEQQTLATLKSHEILAHCMWEMTFWGFDEKTIRKKSFRMRHRVHWRKSASHEEVIAKIEAKSKARENKTKWMR